MCCSSMRIRRCLPGLASPLDTFCFYLIPQVSMAWTQAAVQQMAQGVAGYQDVQRLATDVEEVVRELRSLAPKVDSLGILLFLLPPARPSSVLGLTFAWQACAGAPQLDWHADCTSRSFHQCHCIRVECFSKTFSSDTDFCSTVC